MLAIEDSGQVAKKVREGMNREQFEKHDDDMNEYFDCKIVDNLDEQKDAPLAILSSDQNDELKMDKDLGLFEFISKGDFSTVNGNAPGMSAAAAAASQAADTKTNSNQPQPSTFDFDNFDATDSNNQKSAGQNVDDFFNFNDTGPSNQNNQQKSAADPPNQNNMANDLEDIFSNIPASNSNNQPAAGQNNIDDIFAGSS